jgi:H+-transporting ATPase
MNTGTNTEIGKAQESILKDKSVRVVSVFQTKIMVVVQILVSCCLVLVIAVLLVEGIAYDGFNTNATEVVLDALSILIASIPIALPLVLQVNMALGASFMAREHHAIVTSIPALQDIASMSMLCSDKTGTLSLLFTPHLLHTLSPPSTIDPSSFFFTNCQAHLPPRT